MHPMLTIAQRAARAAGDQIVRYIERIENLNVQSKAQNDFVSEVDRNAEQVIIRTLRRAYPDHAILAEEGGHYAGQGGRTNQDYQWIIDPLDGTTNFLHGFPQYAVSIALQRRGELEIGVIYDPLRQEMFCASRGDGATLNSRRIRVTQRNGLEGALLATGIPYAGRHQQHIDAYLGMLRSLLQDTSGIRRPGSAALDLAYVAAGRVDGFWEIGLKPWDMAAGLLLIREAGGYVGDLTGGSRHLELGHVVAGAPKVYQALLAAIAPHVTPELAGRETDGD